VGFSSRQALAALACASLGWGNVARAAPPPPAADDSPARSAYLQGVEYFKQKRYSDAIVEFNKAYRLDPNPVLVFNMARAFEELKDYGPAVEFYQKYLAMAPDAEDRPQVEETIRTLELLRQRAQAESKVPLAVTSTPDGAKVLIDGHEAGVTPLRVELDPGSHFVALEKDGYERASQEVKLEAGKPERREVQLMAGAPSEPPPAGTDHTWAWVALGVGGALAAGGGFMGYQALQKSHQADDIAAGRADPDEDRLDTLKSDGKRYALVADGLYSAGAACAIAGVILMFKGGGEAPKPASGRSGLDLAISF
jgi:tetratricopeptide (TPR) repeat protein